MDQQEVLEKLKKWAEKSESVSALILTSSTIDTSNENETNLRKALEYIQNQA